MYLFLKYSATLWFTWVLSTTKYTHTTEVQVADCSVQRSAWSPEPSWASSHSCTLQILKITAPKDLLLRTSVMLSPPQTQRQDCKQLCYHKIYVCILILKLQVRLSNGLRMPMIGYGTWKVVGDEVRTYLYSFAWYLMTNEKHSSGYLQSCGCSTDCRLQTHRHSSGLQQPPVPGQGTGSAAARAQPHQAGHLHLVLYCTVLHCTVLHCTVLHCTKHNLTRQDIFITSKIPVWNQDPSWPSLADCHRGLQVTQPLQFWSVTYEHYCRQYLLSFKQNTWIFS